MLIPPGRYEPGLVRLGEADEAMWYSWICQIMGTSDFDKIAGFLQMGRSVQGSGALLGSQLKMMALEAG